MLRVTENLNELEASRELVTREIAIMVQSCHFRVYNDSYKFVIFIFCPTSRDPMTLEVKGTCLLKEDLVVCCLFIN